ncbi:serine/threonine phosphatase stp [Bacteroidia bacterium]|nr:serine/threonine phosphatase stp [Bacteroidia bacterium]
MQIKTDLNCNIGCVRQNNEDIILLGDELFRDKAQKIDVELTENARYAAVVCDGMGGHNGGEYASEMAAQLFSDYILDLPAALTVEELTDLLKKWAENAHRIIVNKSTESAEYDGMGTTFCGILFYESLVFALNIGDSRLYRFRNGILKQISRDHSMRELTGDSSLPSNQIYNSLGAGDSAFIDVKDLTGQLFDGDLFLICSDGLCDMISDEETEQILAAEPVAEKLVEAAKAMGGKDNVSVILLSIKDIEQTEI